MKIPTKIQSLFDLIGWVLASGIWLGVDQDGTKKYIFRIYLPSTKNEYVALINVTGVYHASLLATNIYTTNWFNTYLSLNGVININDVDFYCRLLPTTIKIKAKQ